jgi:hypothetical protein
MVAGSGEEVISKVIPSQKQVNRRQGKVVVYQHIAAGQNQIVESGSSAICQLGPNAVKGLLDMLTYGVGPESRLVQNIERQIWPVFCELDI